MRAEPLPQHDAPPVRLTIDNLTVAAPLGTSVLHAAEGAGILIPSLCAHKELSPFGSCRLCAVQIDGVPGFPLACSTPAADGMRVVTDSAALRRKRRDVLELILSQHPSSCLICEQRSECRRSQETIHKAGVATGCHSCSNDGDCELQLMVERIGVRDISFPITYRGLEPELDDPFYDRDYNLCILCGRCVRMCQEVRGTAVLAFKFRGPHTLIGPAFGESHVEAGCEFCGACVTVCPTGTLAERVSKWDGLPDERVASTCPFCFLGCQLELTRTGGRLSSARGAPDPEINDGQLCVRGAFCLPETTHHFSRLRKPMLRQGVYFRVASWDEALDDVVTHLHDVSPHEVLMLVSADLTNEGLYAGQRFVRRGLGSEGIDSTTVAALPGGAARWSRLFSLPISLRAVAEADAVIVAGLDSRFSFSVVGVQARRALRRGATMVTIDARESNLALMADHWLHCKPGEEARGLSSLLRLVRATEPGVEPPRTPDPQRVGLGARVLRAAATAVTDTEVLAVIIGPRVFDSHGVAGLMDDLESLAARPGATIIPITGGSNIRGALELGAAADLLPGPRPTAGPDAGRALSLAALREGRRPKVIYLVGEAPFTTRPDGDYVIAQDLYPPPFDVDAFLPAASFAEADGTLTNIEGRVQELLAAEKPDAGAGQGEPRPDWRIFSDLAARLDSPELVYEDPEAVRAAIHAELSDFPAVPDRRPRRMTPLPVPSPAPPAGEDGDADPRGRGRFLLIPERAGFRHRGIDLSGVVGGLGELRLEEGLRMCPEDMERLCVQPDDTVTVTIEEPLHVRLSLPARPDPDCPSRTAYVTRRDAWGGLPGDSGLEQLARLPARPVRVRIASAEGVRPTGTRASAGAASGTESKRAKPDAESTSTGGAAHTRPTRATPARDGR